MTSPTPSSDSDYTVGGGSRSLLSASFVGLLVTQFLGAANDNILRWLVIGIGKQYVAPESVSWILAAGSAAFVLPYVLLAAPSGYLADRFSKQKVIVTCKMAEVAIMITAVLAVYLGSVTLMLLVVTAMGAQSALFGPSKLGSIPEMLNESKISSANGVLELTTVVAVTIGMVAGNWLTTATGERGREHLWLSALVMIGFAAAGLAASLLIRRLPIANARRKFPWDAARQTWRDVSTLAADPAMFRVALGIMFFWSLAMMAQLNIDQFAFQGGATKQTQVAMLLVPLIVGVGLGSILAGVWSAGRVELGILPLGAGGLAFSAVMLYTVEGELYDPSKQWTISYIGAAFLLFLLGTFSGLFNVPLAAYMQRYSLRKNRGSILAACNFLTFGGMLVTSGLYWLAGSPYLQLSARDVFLICGVVTLPVLIYIVAIIPQASIRFLAWLITHSFYKIRVHQRENLPETGGALLVPNHVSWIDGLLLVAVSPRPIRLVITGDLLKTWWARGLARIMGAIPIFRRTPKATRSAIETAREALNNGELVCIFPEGGISRSGQLQTFSRGTMEILRGTSARVIPVYLDELWGSIFTFRGGRLFRTSTGTLFRPVSVWFGKHIEKVNNIHQLRQAVQDLGADAVSGRKERMMVLPRLMLRKCRKSLFRFKIADSSGAEATGGSLLMRTLILRRLLLREVIESDEKYVGILLPPSVGAVITNAAVTLAGRVSANLNYTVTNDVLNACIRKAGIRHVLTSKKVMEKLDLKLDAEIVLLEDFKPKVSLADKLAGVTQAYATPLPVLERILGVHRMTSDDELTVIFTSGSTGEPKGVVLTNHNVGSNVEAIDQVIHLRSDDTLLGILPFFHSFGFMVTLWTVLGLDVRCVYHFTPLDAKQVGKLCGKWGVTVLLSTPTFLRSYLRKCEPADFSKLEIVVAGAEKLPVPLCDEFEAKFGVRPVEGYGATELSPLVSVNVPPKRSQSREEDCREGTVGRPIPGVSAKIVDPDTGEPLDVETPGMLLVKGPNVMKEYLGDPDKTAGVLRDGWYVTGDIALIDKQGFIQITGRLSRFSKIGGEMVPHINIEEAIQGLVQTPEDEVVKAVVTAVPDERKGERLIVVHTKLDHTPQDICDHLAKLGLPNLWLPSTNSFLEVEQIPVLGTGKLDLKGLSDLAKKHFAK
ncbi:acyl-[ACP]--phospholipid O-acyltransferase [Bythopirellula goksoeyrii]|uniref:Bifunctional protein Aas n=1 Tax=Bythopirellula goksoeyrii TaxID=1400387 RepID=A0A5B9Q8L2_9BACT|nr:acyl-[ACP]--phospholipid O-acyltransferase [Bythopirellula goksoeyrii]QEG35327.1 Bifunctional protein Aas [Bythopirellula goksoeyrii]